VQNALPDPPDRIGDELDVLFRIVLFGGVDQADVPLVDEVEEQDLGVPITLGVGNDETEVCLDQLFERALVVLVDALAQLALPLRGQPGDSRDFLQILTQEVVRLVVCLMPGLEYERDADSNAASVLSYVSKRTGVSRAS
jgi:hypothetical protein